MSPSPPREVAAVEKLLGWFALLAPLPLPLNGALGWPELALYVLLVTLFLGQRHRGHTWTLPVWAMNLLGLAYLPLLLWDLRMILLRSQLIQTVVHLTLFAIVVKLFALRRLRDVSQTFGAAFFVFLASVATSVHPSVVLYLLVAAGVALGLLARLALVPVLSSFGRAGVPQQPPLGRFLVAMLASSVVLAIPLFLLFPRTNAPFMGIRGTGTGTEIFSTGFSDQVDLDSIGSQRDNQEIALRLRYEGPVASPQEIRLKGGSFERYRGKGWSAAAGRAELLPSGSGEFVLASAPARDEVEIWLQPLGTPSLLLPVEATALRLPQPLLLRNRGGAVSLLRRPSSAVTYRVRVAQGAVPLAAAPSGAEDDFTLDTEGLSPAIRLLASEVLGEGSDRQRAERLLRFFEDDFTFSLQFMGRTAPEPLDQFLFETRQGHCELFASSMVLMLRSQGIPSRLATGFLGAELNPLTGFYVVRQNNAHAWVEAFLDQEGWVVLDPTPAAGLPGQGLEGVSLWQQISDFVLFRWDRYVLTFGMADQVSLAQRIQGLWQDLTSWLKGLRSVPEEVSGEAAGVVSGIEGKGAEGALEAPASSPWLARPVAVALGLAALLMIGGWLLLRQRRRTFTATQAFRRWRRWLRRQGVEVAPATPPQALARLAAERFPETQEPTANVIEFYLRESFGGQPLEPQEREQLRRDLRRAAPSRLRRAG